MGMFSKIELEMISTSEWIGDYSTQLNLKLSSASSHFFLTQLIVTTCVSNLPGRCPKPSLLPAQVINHSNVLILFVRETVSQTWGLHNLNFFLNFLQASLSSGERRIWVYSVSRSSVPLSAHLQHFLLLLYLSIAVRENFRTHLGVFIFRQLLTDRNGHIK